MPTTKDLPFFSKSNSVGSARWKVQSNVPGFVAGFLIDGAFQHLDSRWYVVWLQKDSGGLYWINATLAGNAEEFDLSLESFNSALTQNTPIIRVPTRLENEFIALERFQRIVSNIMHGLLEPSDKALFLWEKFALSEDGSNVYSSGGKAG